MTRRWRLLAAELLAGDRWILGLVLLLAVVGTSIVYSAGSFRGDGGASFLLRHLVRLVAGLALMTWIATRDLSLLRRRELLWGLVALSLALLAATVVLRGTPWVVSKAGIARWLRLPLLPFPVQPVELVKVSLVLFLAERLSGGLDRLRRRRRWLPVAAVPGMALVILLLQPNFSNALVLLLVTVLMLWLAGLPQRLLLGVMLAGVLLAGAGYRVVPKIQHRLGAWWQGASLRTEEFQVRQGLIALGAGGTFGRGLGGSRQRQAFLPESQTDYVFAVLGEETGLAGTLLVLAAFLGLAWRGIGVARRSGDRFGALAAAGATGLVVCYALLNMGMVTALLPVLGVPLPLLSFGGSALIANLAAVGVILCVDRANRDALTLRRQVSRRLMVGDG